MRKLTNWFDAYREFTEDFEPPKPFHKWSAIAALSAVTGRKIWTEEGNRRLYPNLYIVLVGPPGCGKGQSMREVMPFIKSTGVTFSPDKVTAAKLVESIASSSIAHPSLGMLTPYLIWAEELPSFLGAQAYETGMISDLTTLYDCPDEWRKETKTRGEDIIPNAYVCMLAATTSQGITDTLPSGTVGQGFTSRLMFVYADYPERRIEEKHWGPKQSKLQPALLHDLQEISKLCGPLKLTDIAKVLWSDFYHYRPVPGEEFGDARLQGYSSRKPMFVKKLAMLMAISEGDALVIDAHHIEQAIQLLKEIDLSVLSVYNEITPSLIISHYPKVLRALEKAQKGTLAHSELMRKFSSTLDKTQFRMVIDGLIDMKMIESEVVTTKLTKRFTVYYKIVNRKGLKI
jgi:hypothetical protein